MKLQKIVLTSLFIFTALSAMARAAAIVTVAVSTDGRSLQNFLGTPLTAGNLGTNNDGAVVQIGYFQGASTASNFGDANESNFVILIGANSQLSLNLTIGDTVANVTGHGEIFADVDVSGRTGGGVTDTAFPAVGVPLSMRIFSGTTIGGSTHYDVVSNDSWVWVTPVNSPSIARIEMNFDIAGLVSKNGQAVTTIGSPVRTTAVNPFLVPEPTSAALLMVGLVSLVSRRRRVAKV